MRAQTVSRIQRYKELDTWTRDLINKETDREFGSIPIVQSYSWAEPKWTVLLIQDNEVLCFYNIVERICRFDGDPVQVAGINNLITPLKYRGYGYGSQIMKTSGNLLFDKLNAEYGLLLCADKLIPFYNRFGWYKTDSKVRFDQPDRTRLWQANVMLLNRKAKPFHPGEIDLCGLPW